MSKPVAAIVGRPNVGKSTLFNKLIGERRAIVEDTPGVTRDRIYGETEWNGRRFLLVDTGGIEPKTDDIILKKMRMQAEIAIETADVIIFICDIHAGLVADDRDIAKDSVKQSIARDIQEIIPMRRAGDFNQALIELGAIVCVPNGPAKCSECPVAHLCEARKRDIVMELPKKAPKKERSIEEKTVLIIKDGEKIAIRKRPNKGLLAGLYELPNVEGQLSEDEVLALVKSYGLAPLFIERLEDSKHIFTHKEWHMTGFAVRVAELEGETDGMLFVERKTVEKEYPIPSAFAAYAKHIDVVLGNKR